MTFLLNSSLVDKNYQQYLLSEENDKKFEPEKTQVKMIYETEVEEHIPVKKLNQLRTPKRLFEPLLTIPDNIMELLRDNTNNVPKKWHHYKKSAFIELKNICKNHEINSVEFDNEQSHIIALEQLINMVNVDDFNGLDQKISSRLCDIEYDIIANLNGEYHIENQ